MNEDELSQEQTHDDSLDFTLNPLALASEDALVNELKSRFPAVVVCVLEHHEGLERIRTTYSGGKYTCLGMCAFFEYVALHKPEESAWKKPE